MKKPSLPKGISKEQAFKLWEDFERELARRMAFREVLIEALADRRMRREKEKEKHK
jgi:hypothetical protein